MRTPRRTGQFKRDVKLAARRGKDLSKLERARRAVSAIRRESAVRGLDRLSPAEIEAKIAAVRRSRPTRGLWNQRGGAVW